MEEEGITYIDDKIIASRSSGEYIDSAAISEVIEEVATIAAEMNSKIDEYNIVINEYRPNQGTPITSIESNAEDKILYINSGTFSLEQQYHNTTQYSMYINSYIASNADIIPSMMDNVHRHEGVRRVVKVSDIPYQVYIILDILSVTRYSIHGVARSKLTIRTISNKRIEETVIDDMTVRLLGVSQSSCLLVSDDEYSAMKRAYSLVIGGASLDNPLAYVAYRERSLKKEDIVTADLYTSSYTVSPYINGSKSVLHIVADNIYLLTPSNTVNKIAILGNTSMSGWMLECSIKSIEHNVTASKAYSSDIKEELREVLNSNIYTGPRRKNIIVYITDVLSVPTSYQSSVPYSLNRSDRISIMSSFKASMISMIDKVKNEYNIHIVLPLEIVVNRINMTNNCDTMLRWTPYPGGPTSDGVIFRPSIVHPLALQKGYVISDSLRKKMSSLIYKKLLVVYCTILKSDDITVVGLGSGGIRTEQSKLSTVLDPITREVLLVTDYLNILGEGYNNCMCYVTSNKVGRCRVIPLHVVSNIGYASRAGVISDSVRYSYNPIPVSNISNRGYHVIPYCIELSISSRLKACISSYTHAHTPFLLVIGNVNRDVIYAIDTLLSSVDMKCSLQIMAFSDMEYDLDNSLSITRLGINNLYNGEELALINDRSPDVIIIAEGVTIVDNIDTSTVIYNNIQGKLTSMIGLNTQVIFVSYDSTVPSSIIEQSSIDTKTIRYPGTGNRIIIKKDGLAIFVDTKISGYSDYQVEDLVEYVNSIISRGTSEETSEERDSYRGIIAVVSLKDKMRVRLGLAYPVIPFDINTIICSLSRWFLVSDRTRLINESMLEAYSAVASSLSSGRLVPIDWRIFDPLRKTRGEDVKTAGGTTVSSRASRISTRTAIGSRAPRSISYKTKFVNMLTMRASPRELNSSVVHAPSNISSVAGHDDSKVEVKVRGVSNSVSVIGCIDDSSNLIHCFLKACNFNGYAVMADSRARVDISNNVRRDIKAYLLTSYMASTTTQGLVTDNMSASNYHNIGNRFYSTLSSIPEFKDMYSLVNLLSILDQGKRIDVEFLQVLSKMMNVNVIVLRSTDSKRSNVMCRMCNYKNSNNTRYWMILCLSYINTKRVFSIGSTDVGSKSSISLRTILDEKYCKEVGLLP